MARVWERAVISLSTSRNLRVSRNLDGDSNVFSEECRAKLKEGDQIFLITYSNESYTSKAIGD